jgi:hypothetical protein
MVVVFRDMLFSLHDFPYFSPFFALKTNYLIFSTSPRGLLEVPTHNLHIGSFLGGIRIVRSNLGKCANKEI